MALTLGRDGQPQLINFFSQLFLPRRGLFLRNFECGQLGLLFYELIAHRLKFALQLCDPFVGRG